MNQYHKNPRGISQKQSEDLEAWLNEFGDLSGVVHNIQTDEIIGGNQRSKVFNINECEIEIVKSYDEPTKTGTMAEGYIIYNDERYTYRQVSWTPEQCEKANIIANKAGGFWEWDILENDFGAELLKECGFNEAELHNQFDKEEETEGKPGEGGGGAEVEYTEELFESHNYVILYFKNDVDWQTAVEKLGIKKKKTTDSTDSYMRAGIGRVLDGAKIVGLIK